MIPLRKITEETVVFHLLEDYITDCIDENPHLNSLCSITFYDIHNVEYDDINLFIINLSNFMKDHINGLIHIKEITITSYTFNELGNLLVNTAVYEPTNNQINK